MDKYLLTAIENNNVSEVTRLLEKTISPNCFGEVSNLSCQDLNHIIMTFFVYFLIKAI